MVKKKTSTKSESHLELRTKTEITQNYCMSLVTLVRVTQRYIDLPKSLKEEIEEEEIYRMGSEDTTKATEIHRQIAEILEHLHNHNLLSVSLK